MFYERPYFPPGPRRPPWAVAAERGTPLSGCPERETARSGATPPTGIPAQIKTRAPDELRALRAASPPPARAAQHETRRPKKIHRADIKAISPRAPAAALSASNPA